VVIAATPDQVWAALSQVTVGELRLFRLLMGVHVLPGRLVRSPGARSDADEPLLGWAVRFGFTILGEDAPRELVFGAIGQPWRLAGGRGATVAGGQDFAAFDQAGHAKLAANFRLAPTVGGSAIQLSTETRVACTDPASARRFARYWRLIRPASGGDPSQLARGDQAPRRTIRGRPSRPRGAGALTALRHPQPRPSRPAGAACWR
jgi:hypothetical protein